MRGPFRSRCHYTQVVVAKGTCLVFVFPYTSVFFELDCGYWTREAEERLRLSLARRKSWPRDERDEISSVYAEE